MSCTDVIPTTPPSTTIETTSGVISSQTTDLNVQSTPNTTGNKSNKTLELATHVTETTIRDNFITTQAIVEPTGGTSVGKNFTVKTSSEPGRIHTTGPVSTTISRRHSSTKTGKYLQCPIVHL